VKPKKPTGIINPFNEPKERKGSIPSPYDDPYGTADEEKYLRKPASLDLDGDSYILRFEGGIPPEKATEALVRLLYAVNTQAHTHLVTHGVWVGKEERDCLVLKTPFGVISVYSDDGKEVSVFRRIGAALWSLPNKKVLQDHRVKVIKRG